MPQTITVKVKLLPAKEQAFIDQKVRRAIVNFAKENQISVMRLKQLANIRQTTRTSRLRTLSHSRIPPVKPGLTSLDVGISKLCYNFIYNEGHFLAVKKV
ncbi:hypothetical protein GCM10007063_18970 [Lentibacillus kapialis]|uniref:Transposase n=1 Tax=Lentibacillus kapialis TaxID=340214 RepID=A0A917UYR4_9BACI|nr:hypothetical protein GCM10007063_18970 [Lentibacillus kapialis]